MNDNVDNASGVYRLDWRMDSRLVSCGVVCMVWAIFDLVYRVTRNLRADYPAHLLLASVQTDTSSCVCVCVCVCVLC